MFKTLDKVYDEYIDIAEFINKSTIDICREENVLPHQVLFILFCYSLLLARNLWVAVFYYHRPKIDAFDYRLATSRKMQTKKNQKKLSR